MVRLLIAVILGQAIWSLMVSLMDNVVVPWLGAVMGPSSGLPASFIQRPYDYPDLFVSIVELCLAGLVAVLINHFFQRPVRMKVVAQKRPVAPATVSPVEIPPPTPAMAPTPAPRPSTPPVVPPAPVVVQPPPVRPAPVQVVEPQPSPRPIVQPAPPPTPVLKPVQPAPVAAPVPAAVKPPPVPPPVSSKPKPPKKIYYNSVGEPIEFDDE
jgi:large-conductance mechanosensitive channel